MTISAVHDNTIPVSRYRGVVSPCRLCKPEEVLLGTACTACMGNGYTALCLNCNGTGSETMDAVWGSKTKHSSTCNICGGKGVLPARKTEYHPAPGADAEPSRELLPGAARPMVNLDIRHTAGSADGAGI